MVAATQAEAIARTSIRLEKDECCSIASSTHSPSYCTPETLLLRVSKQEEGDLYRWVM